MGSVESIQHKGELVEAAIKQSGYQVKPLVRKLGIARNTLCFRLKNANLDNGFIARIGKIMHYDFALAIKDRFSKMVLGPSTSICNNLKGYRHLLHVP